VATPAAKPPTCGGVAAETLGAGGALELATASGGGGVNDSFGAGAEGGADKVGIACGVDDEGNELVDGGCVGAEPAGAAAVWVQALAAAITMADATMAPSARRPRPWFATARG